MNADNGADEELFKCVMDRNIAGVSAALLAGADINARHGPRILDRMPIHFAAQNGDVAMLALLIDAGADMERPAHINNDAGSPFSTPLSAAFFSNHMDAAGYLVYRGATTAGLDIYGEQFLRQKAVIMTIAERFRIANAVDMKDQEKDGALGL